MAHELVLLNQTAGVATLRLNRPEVMNAFTPDLLTELKVKLSQLSLDKSVHCLVITGAGRGFCAGADLAATPVDQNFEAFLNTYYHPVIETVYTMTKPVIAAVNGVAAGAGMSLALACDLRLLSSEAVFTTAFTRIALTLDAGGSYFLPKLVGRAKAFDLSYSSRKVDATEAMSIGLGDRLFKADVFEAETRAFAQMLAQGPVKAYGFVKEQLNAEVQHSLTEHLAFEAKYQDKASKTNDFKEGVAAFKEKRKATFKGD